MFTLLLTFLGAALVFPPPGRPVGPPVVSSAAVSSAWAIAMAVKAATLPEKTAQLEKCCFMSVPRTRETHFSRIESRA